MLAGISLPHILLLLVIVVLVFGTGKLKNAGKDLGGFFKGFKEGIKDADKPDAADAPPAQISQQNSNTQSTVEKKDQV
ncbi:MAG: twin-arginine translocase TatA/TatE family subunit [Moraxellaceae bacterium]|nr:twin-arginine translocase TatA/TatE family subunit [Moraxellaceae bacterium]